VSEIRHSNDNLLIKYFNVGASRADPNDSRELKPNDLQNSLKSSSIRVLETSPDRELNQLLTKVRKMTTIAKAINCKNSFDL
jgi:hypothetical protein